MRLRGLSAGYRHSRDSLCHQLCVGRRQILCARALQYGFVVVRNLLTAAYYQPRCIVDGVHYLNVETRPAHNNNMFIPKRYTTTCTFAISSAMIVGGPLSRAPFDKADSCN